MGDLVPCTLSARNNYNPEPGKVDILHYYQTLASPALCSRTEDKKHAYWTSDGWVEVAGGSIPIPSVPHIF